MKSQCPGAILPQVLSATKTKWLQKIKANAPKPCTVRYKAKRPRDKIVRGVFVLRKSYNLCMVREIIFPGGPKPPDRPDDKKPEEVSAEGAEIVDIRTRQKKVARDSSPDQNKIDGSFFGLSGAGDIFKNYERMFSFLSNLARQTPGGRKQRLLQENLNIVKDYTDEELRGWIRDSNKQQWTVKPMFFYAIIWEATKRKLFL